MANIIPSSHFIEIVSKVLKDSRGPVRIAEIGVDRGATTREIAKLLRPCDVYDLFDREDCTLFRNLQRLVNSSQCKINIHSNTRKTFDSYAWSLAKVSMEARARGDGMGLWDAIYLDGAHTFPVDAPATCVLKEMVKIGGYFVFDDVKWSLASSPTMSTPAVKELYTDEQMDAHHVEMLVDLFMRTDVRFTELTERNEKRAVFIRNTGEGCPSKPIISLSERIKAHLVEKKALLRDCVRSGGGNTDRRIDKDIPQSALFMTELMPTIHRLYMNLPANVQKTCLDVGPSSFGGTALLADLHTEQSFNKLKLKVSAVDILDRWRSLQEMLAPNVEFFVQDIFTIKNRTWDFIICSHVIEHVSNPSVFLKQLQLLARDFVLVASPWAENPISTKGHINTIEESFVNEVGGRDLRTFVNYGWGKQREVCSFWLPGFGDE
ncbi:hypothetical protein CHL67_01620 [Prosthecochloris sp. GSB1]|uniref:class I SAM-dependent methyltransferase n=1 Tax=Prosthecochloris sp. GSB1 TaxID=281093 RepID=UPI000B8C970C|nr:methyltransferase domain-containing protein [Prosthecochloris sp. GSB1]ASQ89792.1 hypothetical protein CHL67_01620 [Prosthecochloris sp. GSB1]